MHDCSLLLAEPKWREIDEDFYDWRALTEDYFVFAHKKHWEATIDSLLIGEFGTADEAKAACFANFRLRIRSCFQPKENHDDPR